LPRARGQQRTAALSTKLAEVKLMRDTTGETPVLLLDDVMSELDSVRRGQVINSLQAVDQAFLTTTDWDDVSDDFRQKAQRYSVTSGQLTPDDETSNPT
jgi:DNA replication and repair protein RecF